jgi:asparagine synthase (glutamine-hydrolysing)
MSKELKKYITVVLSGEGADEIFGGYGRIFRSPDDWEKFNSEKAIFSEKSVRDLFLENYYSKYPRSPFTNQLEHFYWNYSYTKPSDKQLLLNERIFNHCPESKLLKRFEDCISEIPDSSYRNKIHYIFENIHLQGLLNRADMTTMAASVEARVPFVDHRLVEFAFTIPEKYKLKWKNDAAKRNSQALISDQISEKYDIPKYILKKSAEDKLPKEILYRKKMGFPVPLNNWFGNEFNTYAKSVLLDPSISQQGLLNLKTIENWLSDDKLNRNHGFAMKIWMLINISLFTKKYALS